MPANRPRARTSFFGASLLAAALAVPGPNHAQTPPNTLASIEAGFLHPPADARPMVRWWWFGIAVQKPEILRELEQMRADGIGGAELAFVYPEVLDDPAHGLTNHPFLSPEMLDAVTYAQTEGRRLGLRIDVTLCSGWPYGGPNTPLSEAAGRLLTAEVPVPPNASTVALPPLAAGDTVVAASLAPGAPHHWTASSATPLPLLPGATTVPVPPAAQPRVALFFIAGHTRQQVKRAALGAEGFVLDPFSRQAVATHLHKVGEPLVKAFGVTPPTAIFSDSLEAYGADWTPDLPAEFQRRRGYDLLPHLPELVAGGTPAATRVRHDYGRTLTELVNQNYLAQINSWAHAHGTRFRSQTYGEPAVSLSSQRLVDLPEGEGPQWRAFSTLRWATSANHLFGNPISSGETYTWLHSPVFRATPLDMKMEADIDFVMGENLLIFHGWPYSPPLGAVSEPESPFPGWSLYAAAVFNDHNPWHPVMPAVTAYLTRLSWLLRQGQPANQIALLLPTDDAWANFSPGKVSVTDSMRTLITPDLMRAMLSPISTDGRYNLDFIDADTLDSVGFGTHQILVLPPTDRIPLQTLRRIATWVHTGGHAIAVGRSPTLDAEGDPLPEVAALSRELFNPAHGTLVLSPAALPAALNRASPPDLAVSSASSATPDSLSDIAFIRRKLPDGDIYFVANTGNRAGRITATFATTHPFGVELDPDTGAPLAPASTQSHAGRSSPISLSLQPYDSRVFLFTDTAPKPPVPHTLTEHELADLSRNWRVSFQGTDRSTTLDGLQDWAATPATRHFSGEAVYTRDITLATLPAGQISLQIGSTTNVQKPGNDVGSSRVRDLPQAIGPDGLPNPLITRPGPGIHADLDPPLREAALVVVNGQPAGALWHPPYRVEITSLLRPGTNQIEIRVFNTLLNAWSGVPPHNYQPLIQTYGDRFQMQDLDKVRPLPSGILGEVHLFADDSQ